MKSGKSKNAKMRMLLALEFSSNSLAQGDFRQIFSSVNIHIKQLWDMHIKIRISQNHLNILWINWNLFRCVCVGKISLQIHCLCALDTRWILFWYTIFSFLLSCIHINSNASCCVCAFIFFFFFRKKLCIWPLKTAHELMLLSAKPFSS